MTLTELKNLKPGISRIASIREPNVKYRFTGRDAHGHYMLHGIPFGYEPEVLRNSFNVLKGE